MWGVEYNPRYDKDLTYFKNTLNNLLYDTMTGDFKMKIYTEIKTLINTPETSLSYLLIDGENVFYQQNSQYVWEQLQLYRKNIQQFGDLQIYLFCQEHSIRPGGNFGV